MSGGLMSQAFQPLPGILTELTNVEKEIFWGREYNRIYTGGVIYSASTDLGNTPTTRFRPGVIMAQINSGTHAGKWTNWQPTMSSLVGQNRARGIFLGDINMLEYGTAAHKWASVIALGGQIKLDNILISEAAGTYGIVGHAAEYLLRAQLGALGFIFDDTPNLTGKFGGYTNIEAKTADYTVVEYDNGTLFTTRGAGATVNFTLPATPKKGLHFGFHNVANQTMTITAGTADTMIVFNDLTADSVSFAQANEVIGNGCDVYGDGTGWIVQYHIADELATQTIAT